MRDIRPSAVAGLFYPAAASELRPMVEAYLAAASASGSTSPKALIAPHAGFIYSGPIAASAFQSLVDDAEAIHRIVLVGPAHRLPVRGVALPDRDAFETPLGVVPVDRDLVDRIAGMPQVSIARAAHDPEHCLEVELPFLQVVLGTFSILPLLVTDADPTDVAEVLETVWGGPETRILVSTDLSHYLAYQAARDLDRDTARRVLALATDIETYRACGAVAINGLTQIATSRALSSRLLDLRNSGDTAGDRSRVVGYGSFAFCERM